MTEGRSRLSRLESQQLEAPRQQPEPGVTELEQRIQALMRECDASRAAATPVLHLEKPIWCSEGCPSLDNPPVPDNVQDVEWWLSCRNCELRNALEFGDPGTIVANWWRELPSWQFSQRMSTCIEQSHRGGCETEVSGRQVSIAVHGGESSPLSGCGTMVQSTRVERSVRSRHGFRGIRVGGFKPRSQGEAQTSSCCVRVRHRD